MTLTIEQLKKLSFIKLEDGFTYLDTDKGALSAHNLRDIALWLDQVNEPNTKRLIKEFEDQQTKISRSE